MTNTREGKLSYKPLFKLLIDKELTAVDLRNISGVSTSTMTALRANKSVTLETILKICLALDCSVGDVVEIEYAPYDETDREEETEEDIDDLEDADELEDDGGENND